MLTNLFLCCCLFVAGYSEVKVVGSVRCGEIKMPSRPYVGMGHGMQWKNMFAIKQVSENGSFVFTVPSMLRALSMTVVHQCCSQRRRRWKLMLPIIPLTKGTYDIGSLNLEPKMHAEDFLIGIEFIHVGAKPHEGWYSEGNTASLLDMDTNRILQELITPFVGGPFQLTVAQYNSKTFLPKLNNYYWIGERYYPMDPESLTESRIVCYYDIQSNTSLKYFDDEPVKKIVFQ
ncbi:unnamed protein product [Soboliphyme baturini]|uniref:Uncharacterized protein n=1 Tax=Soboliphyme baturini TaxID=241478 RepID=A0A183IGW0_9BILA|nr:unnamed protein product [Soboliphyme baturini]